jgi:hypothetical protein
MKKKSFVIIDMNSTLWSFGNIFRTWIFIIIPGLFIMFCVNRFYVEPKQEKDQKENRDLFIKKVQYKDVVIGKEDKIKLIEYKDTFFRNKYDSYLYYIVEKGDIVEKKKGDDYYIVTRDDSAFNVKF